MEQSEPPLPRWRRRAGEFVQLDERGRAAVRRQAGADPCGRHDVEAEDAGVVVERTRQVTHLQPDRADVGLVREAVAGWRRAIRARGVRCHTRVRHHDMPKRPWDAPQSRRAAVGCVEGGPMSRRCSRRDLLHGAAGAVLAAEAWPALAALASAQSRPPVRMQTRPIPSSGEALPVVGLGTYINFDVAPGTAEYRALPAVLAALFAAGGTVIDSSPMYQRAEQTTGELLSAIDAAAASLPRHQGVDQRPRGRRRADGAVVPSAAHRAHRPDADPQPGGLAHAPADAAPLEGRRPAALRRHHPLHRLGLRQRRGGAEGRAARLPADQLRARRPRRRSSACCRWPATAASPCSSTCRSAAADCCDGCASGRCRDGRRRPGPRAGRNWRFASCWRIRRSPCVIPGTGTPRYMAENAAAGAARPLTEAERRELIAAAG